MMSNKKSIGHITAIVTVFIWGTTFISTKILLNSFRPIEILFFRFILGLITLTAVYPKRLKGTTVKQELTFSAAGFCGITLYYLLENVALTYTLASNVGIITSTAPLFTAILSCLISKGKERLSVNFFAGFAAAMIGLFLISFGNSAFEVNPAGDILALGAAFVWAVYSILTKKIGGFGYNTIQTTRRVFMYGIVLMIPALFMFDFRFDFTRFADAGNLPNMLFLGLGASALCFVTWNMSVKRLGAVRTSIYIYIVPVITVTASAIVLKEKITLYTVLGTVLTLSGLLISEINFKKRSEQNERTK